MAIFTNFAATLTRQPSAASLAPRLNKCTHFPKLFLYYVPTLPIPTLPPPLIEVFSGNPCLKLLHTLDAASSEAPGYPPTIEIFGALMIQCHEMYTICQIITDHL